jgi:nucleoside-diphosphate-sugar epimerase
MILLTGSNGYLGNVVNPKIRGEFSPVRCIDLGIFSNHAGWEYTKADISRASYGSIFKDYQYDAVIHLAGISNDPSSEIDPAFTERMNVEASKRLIDFASGSGVRRFIFASSASVYGANDNLVTEESPLNPQSHYAESKAKVEEYLLSFKELNPVILRFGTLFGVSSKMRFDLALNLMTRDVVVSGKVKVYGSGENFRPFLHVQDASDVIKYFSENLISGVYNVSVGNIRIKSLAEMVSSLTGSEIEWISQDHADSRNYRMDCTKLKLLDGFFPAAHLEQGIGEVFRWCIVKKDELNNPDYYTLDCWKKYIESEVK